MEVDEQILKSSQDRADFIHYEGSTACVVLITPEAIYCANAGDSRAILTKGSKEVVQLSEDHKPENMVEKERIGNSGHFVESNRVDGYLTVSRAFGDF